MICKTYPCVVLDFCYNVETIQCLTSTVPILFLGLPRPAGKINLIFRASSSCNCYAPTKTVVLGVSRMWGNGVSGVGCNQFFASYSAWGGDSTMWNV